MIHYRDAAPEDGALLGGLTRATFIETFGSLYALADLELFLAASSDAACAADLADPDTAVRLALAGSTPVGFCKVGSLKLPAETSARTAELRQLYIHKPWHGSGIAAVLTEWALAEARGRGAEELWLSVYTDNPRARRFYARYGFTEIGPYHFMVGNQADADILCKAVL